MIGKKIFLATALMVMPVATAMATDIIVDNAPGTRNGTSGGFSYIGSGNYKDHIGGSKYDIYSMAVSRSDAGVMTVKIHSKFVEYNARSYNFGDLFMSTTGWNPTGTAASGYSADNAFSTGTQWNYVYDLNGARYLTGNSMNTTSAQLHKLKDYDLSDARDKNYFKYGSTRGAGRPSGDEHIYRANDRKKPFAESYGGGSVKTNVSDQYLEFVFDVSGTDLATAQQIAFHWTMSCANDIIEGAVRFAGDVPAPGALGLLLLGLSSVGFARFRIRKQAIDL